MLKSKGNIDSLPISILISYFTVVWIYILENLYRSPWFSAWEVPAASTTSTMII